MFQNKAYIRLIFKCIVAFVTAYVSKIKFIAKRCEKLFYLWFRRYLIISCTKNVPMPK